MTDFEVYQGSKMPLDWKYLGLGPSVVMRLAQSTPEGSHLFSDRYFNRLSLIQELLSKKIFATATVMINRLGKIMWKKVTELKWDDCQQFVAKSQK